MTDLPGMPKPLRRLRRGFGCLAAIILAPMIFGCLNILSIKIDSFMPVVIVVLLAFSGLFIWLSRER